MVAPQEVGLESVHGCCLPAVRTPGCHTHGLQGAHRMGLGRSGTWVLFAPLALQALLSPFALDSCS